MSRSPLKAGMTGRKQWGLGKSGKGIEKKFNNE